MDNPFNESRECTGLGGVRINLAEALRVEASVIQVIRVEFGRGAGVDDSVFRKVIAYFALDGKLLAEVDPLPGGKESNV